MGYLSTWNLKYLLLETACLNWRKSGNWIFKFGNFLRNYKFWKINLRLWVGKLGMEFWGRLIHEVYRNAPGNWLTWLKNCVKRGVKASHYVAHAWTTSKQLLRWKFWWKSHHTSLTKHKNRNITSTFLYKNLLSKTTCIFHFLTVSV